MPRYAKITAYNYKAADVEGCSDFSLNQYWGDDYKNIFYVEGDLGRPTFEDIIETESDNTGQTIRTQNSSVQRFNITSLIASPLLNFLKTIDKHDVKTIEFLDTGDVYNIQNIDIDDAGKQFDTFEVVNIVFEDEAISRVSNNIFTLDSAKIAGWDNDNNGTINLNQSSQYDAVNDVFNSWQLYYESDFITPATSGDVIIRVYAESQSGIESLLGIFRGQFGDSFSDSTKWQSTLPIWDYFNLSDTVGHTNRCQFDKRAFATDNGFLSTEIDDRAVFITLFLTIDGSAPQSTKQVLVYTIWGAFNEASIKNYTSSEFGVTTLGKDNQKNTISTIIDTKTDVATGTPISITTPILTSTTVWRNVYLLGSVPAGEHFYSQQITTKGGYLGSSFRFSYGADDFILAVFPDTQIFHSENILNFTTGTTPYLFNFNWWYRRLGGAGFPFAGDVSLAFPAEMILDGVVLNTLPTIVPATLTVVGNQNITLPDTEKHTVRITVTPTGGFAIYTEFEVQLKPLF